MVNMVNAKWEIPVEADSNGELMLVFPDNLLDGLLWNPGDTLIWEELDRGLALKIYKKEDDG